MMRSGKLKGVPWRGLLAAGVVVLVLSVGLTLEAGAATRFVAPSGSDPGNTCVVSGTPCKTITHALAQAVANDTISVAAGTYNLALGETFPLTINNDLTLTGAGAGTTILDATGANQRVITINSGVTAAISGVTITGGAVSCTASGSDFCFATGGGLFNGGTLTLTNSTVSGNTASCIASGSGSVCVADGGGLYNVFSLTNSTVSGNTASCIASGGHLCGAEGGGLFNDGTLTLTNSTVSANTVTCSETSFCVAFGGGLYNAAAGTTTLKNTIVAKQLAGPDCANSATLTSSGFNLDSDSTCHLTQSSDHPGVSNPLLGPLAANGGPTQTHALLAGSPAIDAGTNSGCPATDQRGFRRPVDGNGDTTATCDIGAFELVTVATSLAAAVLPTERTGLVGGPPITAFATLLNTGPVPATSCALAPVTPVPAGFLYQTTTPQNALTGSPNTPVDIPVGAGQNYLFAFTPTAPIPPTELQLSFACANSTPAPSLSGVNTFRLRALTTPTPDPVALVAVGPPNDGILRLSSAGAFAVATINLGASGRLTVSAEAGWLPVTLTVCETTPSTGACLAPPTPTVQTQVNAGATPTFGIVVSATTPIPFDPATNRIQVHLEGDDGSGGTGVAVCTQPLCP